MKLNQGKVHARRILMLATSTIILLNAAACSADGPLVPGLGSASVTATGAVTASGRGLAMFQSVSSGGTSLFQIVIAPVTASTTTWSLQIASYAGRLPIGTYALAGLGTSSDPTASFYYTSGANIEQFNSTSGQLVITTSTPTAVAGSFTFTASDPQNGSATVTAHGSFTAECAPGMSCQ